MARTLHRLCAVQCFSLLVVGCNLFTSFDSSPDACGIDAGACEPLSSVVSLDELAAREGCSPLIADDRLVVVIDRGVTKTFTFNNNCQAIVPTDISVTMADTCPYEFNAPPVLCVLLLESLEIQDGGVLKLRGPHPIAVYSVGDVVVSGKLDVSAEGVTRGPGGSAGGSAGNPAAAGYPLTGGGGGGTGESGGGGGANRGVGGDCLCTGGDSGGIAFGICDPEQRTGGGGGGGGGTLLTEDEYEGTGHGGGGGGWLQIFSLGAIRVTKTGRVEARGGDGVHGVDEPALSGGGGGGGAGGAILLEAQTVEMNGVIDVSGGSGGAGMDDSWKVADGGAGAGSGDTGSADGQPGGCESGDEVGAGGGGGGGRVLVTTCSGEVTGSGVIVPTDSRCSLLPFSER